MKLKSSAEAIAFHFCADVRDIRDHAYQQSRYRQVFTLGDDYMTATAAAAPCARFAVETHGQWAKCASYGEWSVWKFQTH